MEYDSETGNYYDHARYYNPRLGRFMSPDPGNAGASPGNPQSWNGYSYVLNNPETLTDPSGLCGGTGECPGLPCPIGTSVTVTASAPSGVPQALFLENVLEKFSHAALPLHLFPSGGLPLLPAQPQATCAVTPRSLDSYLAGKGSPMVGQGANFVSTGVKYNLDPRLLVSLAGAESTFGSDIKLGGAYNALSVLYNGPGAAAPFSSFKSNINAAGKSITDPANGYNLTNTTTMYRTYCGISAACGTAPGSYGPGTGLYNLNLFMGQQGASIDSLHNPCK